MLFFLAPRLEISVASKPLYILPSTKQWLSASHCVAHWVGIMTMSSEKPTFPGNDIAPDVKSEPVRVMR